eukprot:6246898-Amphidinium_carterae.1
MGETSTEVPAAKGIAIACGSEHKRKKQSWRRLEDVGVCWTMNYRILILNKSRACRFKCRFVPLNGHSNNLTTPNQNPKMIANA